LASADPGVQPLLDYNYLDNPFDRDRLREGVRLALRLADHKDLKPLIGERVEPDYKDLVSDEALDDWMMRSATTYSHISCTCKMGPSSDSMAVVDQLGNVRGMENLRVIVEGHRRVHHARSSQSCNQPNRLDDGRASFR